MNKQTMAMAMAMGWAAAAWAGGAFVPPGGTAVPPADPGEPATVALAGDLRPGERAEAPDAEAARTLETYMDALAEGDWSKALFFVDLETLRRSLLERRLAELKARDPGMSAKDWEEVSAVLQTRELDPGRVRAIMAEVWKQEGYRGMEWTAEAWRPLDEVEAGTWLARTICTTEGGTRKELLTGMRRGEDGWMVAPDLTERLTAAPRRVAIPAEVPLPEEVRELTERYWTAWRAGDWATARSQMSERHREAVPEDVFAARCEALALQTGIPSEWKLQHCRALRPDMLGLGYGVTTSRGEFQALVIAIRGEGGWALEDVQVRRAADAAPAGKPAPAAPGSAERPFSTDFKTGGLKTDLRTPLGGAK